MKTVFLSFLAMLLLSVSLSAQARVQIIHNSPTVNTASGPTVDIYVNGALLPELTAVPFRAATPYLDVAAGVDIEVAVALSPSNGVDDAIATFPLGQLDDQVAYSIVANGIVGNPNFPFGLAVADGRENALDPAQVDIRFFHGSADVIPLDIDVRDVLPNLAMDVGFGQFSDYSGVAPGNYFIDIRPAGVPTVALSYPIDLSGLAGGAATVFASGLIGADLTPDFGIFVALPDGTVFEITGQAQVQVIHNSPTAGTTSGPTVDIYVNGGLLPELTAVPFRAATAYLGVASETDIEIAVAVSPSTGVDDAIATFPLGQLAAFTSYTIIAGGIVGDVDNPFNLFVSTSQQSASDPDNVDVLVFHGSPGAPNVDVDARGVADNIVSDLAFGEFTADYLALPPADYLLDVRAANDPNIVASFTAPLSGLAGGAATVFASGILGDTPGFGLFAALPDGTVIELPATSQAQVQVIHNSPTAGTTSGPTVDIYVNGGLLPELTAVPFRAATAYLPVPGDADIEVAVAVSPSNSVDDAIATFPLGQLVNGENYTIIAGGIVGDVDNPFNLFVSTSQQAAADPDNVDVLVFHGSPGAPNVDVDARGVADNIVSDLAFGEFTADYLALPPADYLLDVRAANDPNIVASFTAPLSGLAGGAATVFASGILGDTPGFGLFAALPDGTVIELPATSQARVQVIHNSPTVGTNDGPTVDIYVNGGLLPELTAVPFRAATPFLDVPGDVDIEVAVAVSPSNSVDDAIATFPLGQLVNAETYVIVAGGVVGNVDTPFSLFVSTAQEAAADPNDVDLRLFHGSPDAPEVDVVVADGPILFDNVAYGNFSNDYINVAPDAYVVNVTPSDDNETVVAAYNADVSTLTGGAAIVFASGFLTEDNGGNFGVWVALPDGTTFPLSEVVSTNEISSVLSNYSTFPNPTNRYTNVSLTLEEAGVVTVSLVDMNGRVVQNYNLGNLPSGTFQDRIDLGNQPAGLYQLRLQMAAGQATRPILITN